MLGKLREGLSVILGDEMGLGKTIQTAVFLQVGGRVGGVGSLGWWRSKWGRNGSCTAAEFFLSHPRSYAALPPSYSPARFAAAAPHSLCCLACSWHGSWA